jgi:hypothetical protein
MVLFVNRTNDLKNKTQLKETEKYECERIA